MPVVQTDMSRLMQEILLKLRYDIDEDDQMANGGRELGARARA